METLRSIFIIAFIVLGAFVVLFALGGKRIEATGGALGPSEKRLEVVSTVYKRRIDF